MRSVETRQQKEKIIIIPARMNKVTSVPGVKTGIRNIENRIGRIFYIVIFLFSTIPLVAAGAEGDKELLAESVQADLLLNKTLEEVIEKIRKDNKDYPLLEEWIAEIKKSHEAWLSYREIEIQAVGHMWRNGGAGRAQTQWKIKITKERIEHLKRHYDPRK